MLNIELMSKTRTPSVNEYYYKPKQSPAFNDLLYREKALEQLKKTFPEPMIEQYFECIFTIIIITVSISNNT